MRVGIGYDIHPLKKGRKLILGGIEVPFSKGLVGHSDGDALFHAIIDAVLGAMGEEDIGSHFSDKDAKYKGASSLLFVKKINSMLKQKRLKISHIDSTIIAQSPKLYDYKARMKASVARAFGIPLKSVGVKAKTKEGFDAVGKGRAIESLAVVSLKG